MATYGGAPYGGSAYGGAYASVTFRLGVVYNTILGPNALPVPGVKVEILLMPTAGFRTYDDETEVARQMNLVSNALGYWETPLELNTNITPALTYYRVTELIPEASGGRRVWNILVNATGPSRVSDIRTIPLS